jgi:hypothetical protein
LIFTEAMGSLKKNTMISSCITVQHHLHRPSRTAPVQVPNAERATAVNNAFLLAPPGRNWAQLRCLFYRFPGKALAQEPKGRYR